MTKELEHAQPFPLDSKGRPVYDPKGADVVWNDGKRDHLGRVVRCYFDDGPRSGFRLEVRNFDGSQWPADPPLYAVKYLPRTAELGE